MQVTKEQIAKAKKMLPSLRDKSDDEVAMAFLLAKEITDEFVKNYKKQDR